MSFPPPPTRRLGCLLTSGCETQEAYVYMLFCLILEDFSCTFQPPGVFPVGLIFKEGVGLWSWSWSWSSCTGLLFVLFETFWQYSMACA